ncbi:LicD family protein [Roseovarius aestuarii]|nr:LicD family protein [Roseovarius aestuarii]
MAKTKTDTTAAKKPKTVPLKIRRQRSQIAIIHAQHVYADGDVDGARQIVIDAIREHWTSFLLWSELGAMMSCHEDFDLVYDLWLSAPKQIVQSYSALRAVARAACITGHTDEGRILLRRMITIEYKKAAERAKDSAIVQDTPEPDSDFSTNAIIALRDLYTAFQDLPTPFIVSGTLLGLVREGDFISWDKDIDVGIFCDNDQAPMIEEKLRSDPHFSVRKVDLTAVRIRLVHNNKTMVDVFPHYRDPTQDIIWHDGSATRWWNSPFGIKPAEFLGETVMIPDNPELYLDENFGDWRTPVSMFDARLDTPNLQVTDPEYLVSLHYFSLVDAIRKNKPVLQERYAKMLAEIENDTWFLKFAGFAAA